MNKEKINTFLTYVFCIMIAVMISLFLTSHLIIKNDSIKLSDLEDEVGIRLCTESTNSKILFSPSRTLVIDLWNVTQEQMNEYINDYPDAEIIKSTKCIGNKITIYKTPQPLEIQFEN